MFAVIETGGKQYKVAKNDILKVEKLDSNAGDIVVFDKVLAVGDEKKTTLGKPYVKNMTVSAEVIEEKKDRKVLVFKKRRRQNYRRKNGHRQTLAWIKIQDIGENLTAKKAPAAAKAAAPKTADKPKAAPKKAEAAEKKPAAKKASSSTAKKSTSSKSTKK